MSNHVVSHLNIGNVCDGLKRVESINDIKNIKVYGFIDKDNNEVVPFKYDFAFDFSKGVAMVSRNGKWTMIDTLGKEIIPLLDRSTFAEVVRIYNDGHVKNNKKAKTNRDLLDYVEIINSSVSSYAKSLVGLE